MEKKDFAAEEEPEDFIDRLRGKDATMTREFRKKFGCSEVSTLSSQALFLINDLVKTILTLQEGVKILARTEASRGQKSLLMVLSQPTRGTL